MKKVKLMLAAVAILFFGLINLSAQNNNNKEIFTDSWEWGDIMPCTDDYVFGTETMIVTWWDSKTQIRYKGTYEGLSGSHYSWSMVINDNWKEYVEGNAFSRTYTSTNVIECEGVPIALYKIRFHLTINANGEVSVEKYSDSGDSWICL